MPLSTSSEPKPDRLATRSEASTTAVTRPEATSTATIRSVRQTLAHTVPFTHSSSFNRSTGRPSRVTSNCDNRWKLSGFRKVRVADPSDWTSVAPSRRHSPQPCPP